jgi:hypothetical protein
MNPYSIALLFALASAPAEVQHFGPYVSPEAAAMPTPPAPAPAPRPLTAEEFRQAKSCTSLRGCWTVLAPAMNGQPTVLQPPAAKP